MGQKSNYLAQIVANFQLGNGIAPVPPANYYYILSTQPFDPAATGAACDEVGSGLGYSRPSVANNSTEWPAATGGNPWVKKNAHLADFGTPTADWGEIKAIYLADAATNGNIWYGANVIPISITATSITGTTWTSVSTDDFATIDSANWQIYSVANGNATFGAPTRIQTYTTANATAGAGSSGATGGTSLKLRTTETDAGSGTLPSTSSAGTRYSYNAGMLGSGAAGKYYPRYSRIEWRAKLCHGQGLWESFWLTAKIGGADMCEVDVVEIFHSQLPGKNSSTIHGKDNTGTHHDNRYTNNGAAGNGIGGRTFFEAPTFTPGWHTWAIEIVPVTDATGNTLGDPTQPSSYVRVAVFLDGVQVWRVVDTSALYWTTNGGDENEFWNIYLQGCQVDGNFVGHPEDALGYSHWTDTCLISGSPGSCATSTGGYSVQRATFSDPASTVEVDYQNVSKLVATTTPTPVQLPANTFIVEEF